jgi:hypothetical protein
MGVGQRENRQETESYSAEQAQTTAVPDPIVTLIMCLLASPTMADDGIA